MNHLHCTPEELKELMGKKARIDRHAREFDTSDCDYWMIWSDINRTLLNGVRCVLPFPNSANTHWRHARGRTYLSADGKAFRDAVATVLAGCPSFGDARLRVVAMLYPPTKARIDIDNRIKPLFDALTHGGLWIDDEQIDDVRLVRGEVMKPGRCTVTVERINP